MVLQVVQDIADSSEVAVMHPSDLHDFCPEMQLFCSPHLKESPSTEKTGVSPILIGKTRAERTCTDEVNNHLDFRNVIQPWTRSEQ